MKIDAISDMHGEYPKLSGGDLLIIAGDCTSDDKAKSWNSFFNWLEEQQYRKKIIVAGNHDNFSKYWSISGTFTDDEYDEMYPGEKPLFDYLCDSGLEFEGLKIWGSPHSLWFNGINPYCAAFTGNETYLKKYFSLIPENLDILITHTPPYGILDVNKKNMHCGSVTLRNEVFRAAPKIHVFGHIHEQGGKNIDTVMTKFYNVSIMNENYQPTNKPTTIILD